MTTRSQSADLLKGIAVLLMIQVHIIELFASNGIFNSVAGKILLFLGGPPVAPVFTVILGYFIAVSKKTTKQLIIRGVKIFCLGMFLNIALNLNLFLSVNKGLYNVDVLHYIFGVDILHFAGISIIFFAFMKKVFEKNLFLIIIFIGISAFLGQFLLNYIPENITLRYIFALFYGSTQWSYFPLFPWLAYPLTAMAFYQLKQRFDISKLLETKYNLLILISFFLFLAFTGIYAVSVSSNLPSYYHHGLVFSLWAILFLSFYCLFVNALNKSFGETVVFRYLKWLGKNVTIIYVIQWIIIGNYATEIYKTVSSPLHLLLYFLIILFITSCLSYFFVRLKKQLATTS